PQGSVEVTVTEKLVVFAVGVATTSLVGAPSVTVNVALVPAASAGVPLVCVAVSETPAFGRASRRAWVVVAFAAGAVVPVVVPPSEPVAEATERETLDAVVTLLAVPHGSVEVTVTEKLDVFAVGVATTSLVGAPSVTVKVALVPAVSAGVPLVCVAVSETP